MRVIQRKRLTNIYRSARPDKIIFYVIINKKAPSLQREKGKNLNYSQLNF